MTRLWLLLAVCACGKHDPAATSAPTKARPGLPGADWSGKALDATITGKVDGIAFKVSVPKGWIFDSLAGDEHDDKAALKLYRPDDDDFYSEPALTIVAGKLTHASLDEFAAGITVDAPEAVVAKRQLADGFLAVTATPDHGSIKVHVDKVFGKVLLGCQAMQARTGGVPSPEATTAWLSKMCESLALP